jgi:hypothetical protein
MTITIKFELTVAGDCTDNDFRYTYEISDLLGIPHSGSEIRFISSNANTAIFTVFTDNSSSGAGYYGLTVTAMVGLTST